MLRNTFGLFTLCLCASTLPAFQAQDPPAKPEESSGVQGLPSWLRLGFELRGRAEFNRDPEQDGDERMYLNRLRLNVALQPTRWMRFVFRAQDARAFSFLAGAGAEAPRNPIDVGLGYVELGTPEAGWILRAGRQEIALGDERIVGADSEWDPFGLAWDAIRLDYAAPKWRAAAFTGLRVQPASRRFDRFERNDRLSGLSVEWKPREGEALIEPYMFWRRTGDTLSLLGDPGHRDVLTPGLRAQGAFPGQLDYNLEMVLQRGHVAGDHISAWAGHWEAGWKPLAGVLGPRLGFEYNFASGDNNPADGRHQTFDDLYPAGFNQFGIVDLFAWRNIRFPAVAVESPLTRRWTVASGFRAYWLSNLNDGLYPGGDEYLLRNPNSTSAHIGNQVFVSAVYKHSEKWSVQAGYGRLFAGSYLLQSGHPSALRTFYLSTVIGL